MESGDNSLQDNAFGFSEDDEPLVIVDNVPQERKSDSFLIENICDTVLSSESLCLDWEQPPSSSGSTEPIQDTFKDMGIDNSCWYDEDHVECPTAALPPSSDPFSAVAGPVATRTDACVEGSEDGELAADPSLVSTPNNQLMLYKPPEEETPKGPRKNFFVQLHPSKKIYFKPERKKVESASNTSSDENAMAGCCGLRNLGNTCFMAAGIQCLAATPPLVRFFLSEKMKFFNNENEEASCSNGGSTKSEGHNNLTHDFARLLSEMWAGKFGCISPYYFKRSLSVMHPQFKDYRQHDCQEFLTLLLDTLHEQLNDAMKSENKLDRIGVSDQEEAVAGCSQVDSLEALRSSNPDLAFLLANGKNGRIEKNCLEQHRTSSPPVPPTTPNVSPRPEFADTSFLPKAMIDEASFMPRSLLGIDMNDLLKDAKTPNINVLAPQHCEPKPNNLIKFDSEKFSPTNRKVSTSSNRSQRSVRNLTGIRNGTDMVLGENHNDLSNNSTQKDSEDIPLLNGKRLKQTNLLNGLSMNFDGELGEEACSNTNKRLKLVSHAKNNSDLGDIEMMDSEEENSVDKMEELEADSFWQKHLEANKSIVVDSFQGQFKSTVICDVCKHVSITYEPFMYLSVPLPHALERQICVIYLPADVSIPPLRVLLTLKKMDNVKGVTAELISVVGLPPDTNITVCEVLDNHVSKILEPGHQLRFVNGDLRTIYAIEMLPPPITSSASPPRLSPIQDFESPFCGEEELAQPIDLRPNAGLEVDIVTVPTEAEVKREITASPTDKPQWPMCNICLEESDMKTLLKTHEMCGCVVCINCLEMWRSKEKGDLKCPLCRIELNPDLDLTTFTASDKKISRILQVTVVFRLDILGEECSNNKKSMRLIGHPRLVKLPSLISGKVLYETLQHLAPNADFQILLVGGKGTYCSRCMYNKHCVGCVLSPDSPEIIIHPDDSLAIRLMGPLDYASEFNLPFSTPPLDHESMKLPRWNDPLTIHDCLQAFSESEELDSDNPWYCPKCRTNQCATKTLTVWRYPDILIIYLKRFVFNERSISKLDNKVTFPLNGLRLEQPGNRSRVNIYNLYSVVCHFGGASAGHYTAFAKHPRTSEWFNYNDETTIKKTPQEEDYSNGYILFYQRENLPDLFT